MFKLKPLHARRYPTNFASSTGYISIGIVECVCLCVCEVSKSNALSYANVQM